ncbi:ComEA family DNA-binding protein [Fodinibius sediminis]|uniref:Competence protein ComEA helix-hairpin-helix repeat region n=1 Tax=Fodinibius sediminis TaxID=1214077 RepID=A0A521D180_9BACT|nr:helix-hairpin-helix domain-containing protein [Fodinibius sediminis]SMO65465.1 competence protein ComEA helix-hairpin-helix repeat region [Fodinibius sediminis]
MRIFRLSILIGVLMLPALSAAQQPDSVRSEVQKDLEQALEELDSESRENKSEQLIQFLQGLAADPVNINRADLQALRQVPGVNLKIARAIIRYRSRVKPFEGLDELKKITGIGKVTFEKMSPYVTTGEGMALSKLLYSDYRYWTHNGQLQVFSRYQQDLQQGRGYTTAPREGGYVGSPVKYFQRIGYRSDHLSVNLTQEKDAGENLSSPLRFDHQSWHLALEGNGRLQMLALGDYSLSFGQGLVLWNGGSFGKGSSIGTVNRNGRGIKPYTSAQETNYYRGAAVTYGGQFQLTGFYSSRLRSGRSVSQDTTRLPDESGYHRTLNEYERKGNISQTVLGGRAQVEFPVGIIGATGYRTTFDRYVAASDQDYALYNFRGRSSLTAGVDYTLVVGPAVVFGEGAGSSNGGWGLITGLESSIGKKTGIMLAYRNYRKEFQSLLGDGFGEASGPPKNEEGMYMGLEHEAGDRLTLSVYMDQFRFPHARFGTYQATKGYDWLGKIEMDIMPGLEAYLQVKSETKEDEYEWEDETGRLHRMLGEARRSSIRGQIAYWINEYVRMRTRGEWIQSRDPSGSKETGYLMYQDLRLLVASGLTLDARLTFFDTESYRSRVYQFENDLLYVFATEPLFNQGQRMYLLVNYEPISLIEIWAKIGHTKYEDQQVIGSGLNEIQGDSKTEISFQIRFKF